MTAKKKNLSLMRLYLVLRYPPILDILYQMPGPPIHKFDQTLVVQVAKIGNNLNQIAKHVNIGKAIDGVVLRQIIDVNKKLDDLIR